jgi:hypothetical protein
MGVVSRLGGRMYFAPVGFDPYAFLNSDGSGGLSNAPGQLVGAALDLSGGMGYAGPNPFAAGFDLSAAPWITLGTLSSITPTGFTNSSGGGAGRRITIETGFVYEWSVSFTKSDSTTLFGVLLDPSGTSTTASSGTLSGTTLATTGFFYLRLDNNASVTITSISLRRSSSVFANAAAQATTANKPVLAAGPTPNFLALSAGTDTWMQSSLFCSNTSAHWAVFSGLASAAGTARSFLNLGQGLGTNARVAQFRLNSTNTLSAIYRTDAGVTSEATAGIATAGSPFTASLVFNGTNATAALDGVSGTAAAINSGLTSPERSIFLGAFQSNIENWRSQAYFAAYGNGSPTAAEISALVRFARICSGQDLS